MKRKPLENCESDWAWAEPFKLPAQRIKFNAELIDVQSFVNESAATLVAAHTILKLTNAPDLMQEGSRLRAGRRKGGKKAAAISQGSAASWHQQCTDKAKLLLNQGKSPRELAGILAPQFGCDTSTIRRVLKKAGVK